jgi:hypothetical protein
VDSGGRKSVEIQTTNEMEEKRDSKEVIEKIAHVHLAETETQTETEIKIATEKENEIASKEPKAHLSKTSSASKINLALQTSSARPHPTATLRRMRKRISHLRGQRQRPWLLESR